jgi:hypothetical protein
MYAGDLATVDIPVHPHQFHLNLADHFTNYLGLYRQAGDLAKAELYQQKAEAIE